MANLSMSNTMTYKAHRPKKRMNVPGTSLKGGLSRIRLGNQKASLKPFTKFIFDSQSVTILQDAIINHAKQLLAIRLAKRAEILTTN